MKIPFYALDRQYQRYRDDFLAIADRVWTTGRVLQGREVGLLERQCADLCGRRHGVAVGSCTDALTFALKAAGIGPGDEVAVTCYSFVASVSPIIRVGALPRFADIDPDTFMVTAETLEAAVSEQTKAIVAVHLFGQTLDIAAVEEVAARHGLPVIEDAAQALGSRDGVRPGGSLGLVSCLSFDPTKVIGSFSSGGMLITDDDDLAETVRKIRYHGRDPASRTFQMLGYNSQMATDMAGMLSFKLGRLEEWNAERGRVADIYRQGLADLGEVVLPRIRTGSTHTWHKFALRAEGRDALASSLEEQGIATMVHYANLLCDYPFVRSALDREPELPVARAATAEAISLPIYPELTDDEAADVVKAVRSHYH